MLVIISTFFHEHCCQTPVTSTKVLGLPARVSNHDEEVQRSVIREIWNRSLINPLPYAFIEFMRQGTGFNYSLESRRGQASLFFRRLFG